MIPVNSDEISARVISTAREWIGTPYRHQASTKGAGCDCLGLLRGIWRELYGCEPETIPDYTSDWGLISRNETLLVAARRHLLPLDQRRNGCVLVFRWRENAPAKHLAIQSGDNRIIHSYERAGVIESPLGTHWRNRIVGAFTFPPLLSRDFG